MSTVETVRGPVEASQLGTTLVHEHVFILDQEIEHNYPDLWDENERIADAVDRFRRLKEAGIDTIMDPTVIGLGRDIQKVIEVNRHVDLNIVPATGIYTFDSPPFFFSFHGPGTPIGGDEPMISMFIRDLTTGIGGTTVKAGFLKCAIDEQLTPGVERVFAAVAAASLETGAPITIHTNPHAGTGLVAQDYFVRAGVAPSKLVIGHCGDSTDLDYIQRILDRGSYAGMDRFGLDNLLATEERVRTVATLVERGYAEQLVLAHDAACHNDWFQPGFPESVVPNWRFTYLPEEVLPMLRQAGVNEQQLTTMLVDNPSRYLAGS